MEREPARCAAGVLCWDVAQVPLVSGLFLVREKQGAG